MKLKDKIALVTGAGSGIGRATALRFSREGAKLIVADWNRDGGVETVELIKKSGGEAAFVQVDVSDDSQVRDMIRFAVDTHGRIDILFNNAGIEGDMAATSECTEENFDRVIAVNLRGVFLGMKYGIQQMLKQGGGVVINTASVAGLIGFAGLPAYCASKGGVVQLTRTAALEYAQQNIRVNAICPGVIHTSMIDRITGGEEEAIQQFTRLEPVKRMGTPEEIAAVAAFLASEDASFVTGVPFPVDGGFVAQ